jgi:adenylate cyclase
MLRVHIKNDSQDFTVEHPGGKLLLGRSPTGDSAVCTVQDPYVSRNQFILEETSSGVILENVSSTNVLVILGGTLGLGEKREFPLPLMFQAGRSKIDIQPIILKKPSGKFELEADSDMFLDEKNPFVECNSSPSTLNQPERKDNSTESSRILLALEYINGMEASKLATTEGYQQAARALALLARLDMGMVILQRTGKWEIAGAWTPSDVVDLRISKSLLKLVQEKRKALYQDLRNTQNANESLLNFNAAVIAPIFGLNGDVVGALYGVREKSALVIGGITNLEAQVVQALANIIGGSLAREHAIRSRTQFEQFFSPDLVRELETNADLLKGRVQDVTILFSDLRGFTSLSHRVPPQDVCYLLQDVMEHLSEQIQHTGGVIVDYAGDGILAMWNAPVLQTDHAERALKASLGMIQAMHGINQRWKNVLGDIPLGLGVGINSGEALVGNTGSQRKFKYGPLGLTVNMASRVQDLTKHFETAVLISEGTRQRLPHSILTRRVGKVLLAGNPDPMVLHEFPCHPNTLEWEKQKNKYEQALELFEQGKITEALSLAETSEEAFMKNLARCCQAMKEGEPNSKLIMVYKK